jgi:hypothetical protein
LRSRASFDGAFANAELFFAWWRSEVIVDLAVTIVVYSVTSFGFWGDFSAALAPFAVGTGLDTRFALTSAGECAIEVARTSARSCKAVTFDFVNCAIAVIVNAVADFGCGSDFANACSPYAV